MARSCSAAVTTAESSCGVLNLAELYIPLTRYVLSLFALCKHMHKHHLPAANKTSVSCTQCALAGIDFGLVNMCRATHQAYMQSNSCQALAMSKLLPRQQIDRSDNWSYIPFCFGDLLSCKMSFNVLLLLSQVRLVNLQRSAIKPYTFHHGRVKALVPIDQCESSSHWQTAPLYNTLVVLKSCSGQLARLICSPYWYLC